MGQRRVLVIGLDGATLDLIAPWVAQGELPGFAGLISAGASGRLRTVPNTDTAPAWTTFATGLGPANHGLFHELGWAADRRTLRPATGGDRRGQPFWQIADAHGIASLVVNVPFSFPAERLRHGLMIAGIDTPSLASPQMCHPSDLCERLRPQIGVYRIDSEISRHIKEDQPEAGLRAAYAVAEQHTQALLALMQQRPDWQLAVLVYSIPDEMQHFFWQQMRHGTGPQQHAILEGYRAIEQKIAALRAAAGPDATTLVISDHGFGPICATPAFVAEWLAQAGFLHQLPPARQPLGKRLSRALYARLRRLLPEQVKTAMRRNLPALRNRVESDARFAAIDWQRTRAYVGSSPWEVWINTRGREPDGIVAPGPAYEALCAELSAALLAWRDPRSGLPRLRAVHRREALYQGALVGEAADLTLEWNPEAAPPAASLPGNTSRFDADHQPEGVFFAVGPQVAAGKELVGARLEDVAPTILDLLGCAPPPVDGRSLRAAFAAEAEVPNER